MYKLGKGGGGGGRGGGGRRPLPAPHAPAHTQRGGLSAASARLPLGRPSAGVSRARNGVAEAPGAPASAAAEETFSMVSAESLDFAAIIRLTPELVEEIRRLEAQGGAAKIKFDSNTNNLSGNVIDVGGKEFKFTWSRELGVCDIYEQLQNGEDGNGLLSECGSAWRKLNVQRILDESLKNHVKMRSEEAERRLKSRKSIVLDPANPSVKNQARTMAAAAVEGNMRRMHWKKDQVFKKRKLESGIVPNPAAPRSTFKHGPSSSSAVGTMPSASPQPSPPEQSGSRTLTSPFRMANAPKGHVAPDDGLAPPASIGERDPPNKPTQVAKRRVNAHKEASGSHPIDLRNFLINLLADNPKGMSSKALEKAVSEVIPNSGKKFESIIKTIAIYQAPGRYILKTSREVDSSARPPSENGSSPEQPLESLPVKMMEKDNVEDPEIKSQVTPKPVELDFLESIDIEQNSPDPPVIDGKIDNGDEEGACSSSESGSDSDSDSDTSDSGSDSGSQSRSRSKSQSPVGSGSASSSDSESDGSSSGKEGSDVDVDIISDDDKEETGIKVPTSSRLSSSPGGRKVDDGKREESGVEKDNADFLGASSLPGSHDYVRGNDTCASEVTERPKESMVIVSEKCEAATTKNSISNDFTLKVQDQNEHTASPDKRLQRVLQSTSVGNAIVDKEDHVDNHSSLDKRCVKKDTSELKRSSGTESVFKVRPKRTSDYKQFQEKGASSKKPRAATTDEQMSGKNRERKFPEKACVNSPDRSDTRQQGIQIMPMVSDIDQGQSTFDQKNSESLQAGRYMVHESAERLKVSLDVQSANCTFSDSQPTRNGESIVKRKVTDDMEKSGRYTDTRPSRHPEKVSARSDEMDISCTRGMSLHEKLSMSKDKPHKDSRDALPDASERYSTKSILDETGDDKVPSFPDAQYRRSSDQHGIQKETKISLMHKTNTDKPAAINEKCVSLRRELSDLELGEFREPVTNGDTKEGRTPSERKGSFKSSDSKLNVVDNFSSDSNKGRTPAKVVHERKKESPPMSKSRSHANQDGPQRKMSEGDLVESAVPHQRIDSSQPQCIQRTERPEQEPISHLDRHSDSQENQVASHKRTTADILPHPDTKHNGHTFSRTSMDAKPHKFSGRNDTTEQLRGNFRVESINSGKRTDSSSDEDDSFYMKYDKNEPELRGPIKDFSQYKQYVQEYREKYDCYSSLNKDLEKYRNEFLKVGHDLEYYKRRDKEAFNNLSQQIMQMYHQCKKKHSRMKRIFIILHEELKILKQRIQDFAQEYHKD